MITATTTAASAAIRDHGRDHDGGYLRPGNLLVSSSVYTASRGILTPGVTVLPPGCTAGCAVATSDGSYPGVWNNALADGSFGVTAPIFLDQITPAGRQVSLVKVADGRGW